MPAEISYTTFTDPTYFFESMAEANAFFSALRVADATTGARGVVLMTSNVDYSVAALANEDVTELDLGGTPVYLVPLARYVELETAFEDLMNTMDELLTKLKAAGIITT